MLSGWLILGLLVCLAAALRDCLAGHVRRIRQCDGSGDPGHGIVVFVEPVRWLFVIWGFVSFCRGLRRAGLMHQVRLFRWSNRAGALLVLPDLMRRRRLQRKARRLAAFIDDLAARHPDVPIHVCGYSSGCYVALEAVRDVRATLALGQMLLLAPSFSPSFDLREARRRVAGIHLFHSGADVAINGLGPLLFGCNDRRWCVSAGVVGVRAGPWLASQRAWALGDVAWGYFGDHFTITSPAFVAQVVAPRLRTAPPVCDPPAQRVTSPSVAEDAVGEGAG
jgi:pimeloyl-ACP methyl ester carboxylesterase